MKTILITGGAGFMGSNFAKYLYYKYPGYKIVILDALTYAGNMENFSKEKLKDSRFVFWYGNVRNATLVDLLVSQSDIVVHFAAETHVTRSIFDNFCFFETDVLGTQVVANSVLKYYKSVEKFIHISTSEVYGTARSDLIDEEHPLMPASPYAAAKAGADRLVYSYWHTYNIPAIIVRPFNNYGPYQHLEKLIPRFITSCILNEPLTIHGDGKSQRDWLYVGDLCDALDRLLKINVNKVRGECINIGGGKSYDINTIAEMVTDTMSAPKKLITHIGDRPGQVFKQKTSIKKAEKLLGWKPKVSFEEGLRKTIEWYLNNKKWWERLMWMRHIPIVTKEGKAECH